MGREHLFRGRRVYNGELLEWVEGRLIAEDVIMPLGQEFELEAERIWGCDLKAVEVNLGTVGEFTGLYDKNGKRIYEGDIVKCTSPEQSFRTVVKDITNGVCTRLKRYRLEVIGNIHE